MELVLVVPEYLRGSRCVGRVHGRRVLGRGVPGRGAPDGELWGRRKREGNRTLAEGLSTHAGRCNLYCAPSPGRKSLQLPENIGSELMS